MADFHLRVTIAVWQNDRWQNEIVFVSAQKPETNGVIVFFKRHFAPILPKWSRPVRPGEATTFNGLRWRKFFEKSRKIIETLNFEQ